MTTTDDKDADNVNFDDESHLSDFLGRSYIPLLISSPRHKEKLPEATDRNDGPSSVSK